MHLCGCACVQERGGREGERERIESNNKREREDINLRANGAGEGGLD